MGLVARARMPIWPPQREPLLSDCRAAPPHARILPRVKVRGDNFLRTPAQIREMGRVGRRQEAAGDRPPRARRAGAATHSSAMSSTLQPPVVIMRTVSLGPSARSCKSGKESKKRGKVWRHEHARAAGGAGGGAWQEGPRPPTAQPQPHSPATPATHLAVNARVFPRHIVYDAAADERVHRRILQVVQRAEKPGAHGGGRRDGAVTQKGLRKGGRARRSARRSTPAGMKLLQKKDTGARC